MKNLIISAMILMLTGPAFALTSSEVKDCYDVDLLQDPQGILKIKKGHWMKFTNKAIYSVSTKTKGSLPAKQFPDETGMCLDANVSDKYPDHYKPELSDDSCLKTSLAFSKVSDKDGLNQALEVILDHNVENLKAVQARQKEHRRLQDEEYQMTQNFKNSCGSLDHLSPANRSKISDGMKLAKEIQDADVLRAVDESRSGGAVETGTK